MRLVEGSQTWVPYRAARFEDSIIVEFDSPDGVPRTLVVDECGTASHDLPRRAREVVQVFDRWLIGVDDETGAIRRFDAAPGTAPHALFESSFSALIAVAGGLAVIDERGTLWFRAAPDDPNIEAVALHDGVANYRLPRRANFLGVEEGPGPVPDGDAILVAIDGELVRVPVDGGDVETLVEGPVSEFVAIDEGRRLLWVGGSSGGADCCSRRVLDRSTGANVAVGSDVLPANVVGTWLFQSKVFDTPGTTDAWDLELGTRTTIAGLWSIDAVLDDDRLLVHDSDTSALLDPATGSLTMLEFPPVPWRAPRYDDGFFVVAANKGEPTGALLHLSSDGSEIDRVADDVARDFVRTQRHDVVFRTNVTSDDTGTLEHIDGDGRRHTVGEDVVWFEIPGHGTVDERREVIYASWAEDGLEVWRHVLP